MWRRVVDCLGVAVEISSPLDELRPVLDAVFRSYREASAQAAAIEYRLELGDWPQLVRGRRVVSRHDVPADLVPALELDLYTEVLARAPGLLLHAGAVVGAGGAALVFAGPSGAGKSTLVRALLARRFAYLTEECVSLSGGGRCLGLARPLHLDENEAAVLPGFTCYDYAIRQGTSSVVKRLLHPPAQLLWHGEARALAVIRIEYAPGAAACLEQLSSGDALARLWPAVFRPDSVAIEEAAHALADLQLFRLSTARVEQAVDRAFELARGLGVEPN
jgi:hypothetical protein